MQTNQILIVIGTSRKHSKISRFFPLRPSLIIGSHHRTLYVTYLNLNSIRQKRIYVRDYPVVLELLKGVRHVSILKPIVFNIYICIVTSAENKLYHRISNLHISVWYCLVIISLYLQHHYITLNNNPLNLAVTSMDKHYNLRLFRPETLKNKFTNHNLLIKTYPHTGQINAKACIM